MLEDRLKKLELRLEETEYHQKKVNIVIRNLPERNKPIKTTVLNFFKKDMKIPEEIFSNMKIDVMHRIPGKSPRPLVVKFVTLSSRLDIMGYTSNLQGSGISVSVQMPKDMQERRSAQLPALKQAKLSNPETQCKLVKDKLFVGEQIIDPQFEVNPVIPTSGKHFNKVCNKITSSNEIIEKGSRFQAHSFSISSIDEVKSALAAIQLAHPKATHRVYAYRFTDDQTGSVISGHSDDGEWNASKILMKTLNDNGSNKFVAVTRYFGGLNLGHRRFEIYKEAAAASIS